MLLEKIKIFAISTTEQIADIFTKPLPQNIFLYLRKKALDCCNHLEVRSITITAIISISVFSLTRNSLLASYIMHVLLLYLLLLVRS